MTGTKRLNKGSSSTRKVGLRKKVGDAIERIGDKIEHAGLKKTGDLIEKFGDKIEHSGDRKRS